MHDLPEVRSAPLTLDRLLLVASGLSLNEARFAC